eukprot:TRINITY_DN8371_c0_g1_i1.p1 TRINITY_DN8371_c0_g1~~TRINITY_DN8371_c0_g1_i1.p1  ORF type:complete len:542 (+),score=180.32 TRINITY_DN8371_c0_g1_i1:96-1721(+)
MAAVSSVKSLLRLRQDGALDSQELAAALQVVLVSASGRPLFTPTRPPPAPAPAADGRKVLYCGVNVQQDQRAIEESVLSAAGLSWESLRTAGFTASEPLHVTTYFMTEMDDGIRADAAAREGQAVPLAVTGLCHVPGGLLCATAVFTGDAPPHPAGKLLHITLAVRGEWKPVDSNAVLAAVPDLSAPFTGTLPLTGLGNNRKGSRDADIVYAPLRTPLQLIGTFYRHFMQDGRAPQRKGPSEVCDQGLAVLVCGIPGSGKDYVGRKVAEGFPGAAAFSQDQHGKGARKHFEKLMSEGKNPIFVLRNNFDPSDRGNYADLAWKHRYAVCSVCPAELCGGADEQARLLAVSAAGCYGRLTADAAGHETLTVTDSKTGQLDMTLPMRIAYTFMLRFKPPSAELEHFVGTMQVPLTRPAPMPGFDMAETARCVKKQRSGRPAKVFGEDPLPPPLAGLLADTLESTQLRMAEAIPVADLRADADDTVGAVRAFVEEQLRGVAAAPHREGRPATCPSLTRPSPRSHRPSPHRHPQARRSPARGKKRK